MKMEKRRKRERNPARCGHKNFYFKCLKNSVNEIQINNNALIMI